MFESGQNWKIAALRASKCVCSFFWSDKMTDEEYMKIALKEANKAARKGDVPVGAVIVQKNRIVAKAYNKKQARKNALKHAEILAINQACKKLKTWHLVDCTLYVTLEPCLMCAGAILQSRINKIVYATSSPKFGYIESLDKLSNGKNNHIPIIEKKIFQKESEMLLKNFFQNKR